MRNLSEGVEARRIAKGRAKGRTEGLLSALQNLMDSMGLTIDQAMMVLKVSETDRPKYRDMLERQ